MRLSVAPSTTRTGATTWKPRPTRTGTTPAALVLPPGVPAELVEITVHKSAEGVRFGWRPMEAPAPAAAEPVVTTSKPKKEPAPKVKREERNEVKRPRAGGLCAAVWAWLDAHPAATIKEAKGRRA